jgi:hypothetical protein
VVAALADAASASAAAAAARIGTAERRHVPYSMSASSVVARPHTATSATPSRSPLEIH